LQVKTAIPADGDLENFNGTFLLTTSCTVDFLIPLLVTTFQTAFIDKVISLDRRNYFP